MTYRAPVTEMMFLMNHLAGLEQVTQLPNYREIGIDSEMAQALASSSRSL